MIKHNSRPRIRCAIYTRKSHEEGLDQEFNSLDAQRQAGEAFIESQRHEGWQCLATRYDDGGFTGGNMDRPALRELIGDIRAGRIDCVVVYKVDRLSRSLLDFSRLIDVFEEHQVSFVSVTQQFNTTTSMGRLTLNILLSFAQFEREIIGERIRDKKLATARLGKYIGGQPVLGLDIVDKKYVVNRGEATLVRRIYELFLELQSCRKVAEALNAEGLVTKKYCTKTGKEFGGVPWKGRSIYDLLTDRKYIGQIVHKGQAYPGEHVALIEMDLFEQVQATLRANKTYTHRHQVRRFALLRRMLHCGHCGSLIQPAWARNHGREYHYYTCARRIKTGYGNCTLPALSAGEIEALVLYQVRALLRHPDLIARTYREIQDRAAMGPDEEAVARLAELCLRREQTQQSIRAVLGVAQPDDRFLAGELKRLKGELDALERSIRQLESESTQGEPIELSRVTDALQRIDPVWDVLYPEEQRRVLELLVERIRVFQDHVEVRFRCNGIEQIVGELCPPEALGPSITRRAVEDHQQKYPGLTVSREDNAIVVRIPVTFCRRNGRQLVLTHGGEEFRTRPDREANSALVSAVAKAYHWQEQLESGQYASLEELAAAHGVDRSYAGRILRLTSLSPEIVEAILDGNEPKGMTLAKLRKRLPLIWSEQRWD